jgi:hypothetical protein
MRHCIWSKLVDEDRCGAGADWWTGFPREGDQRRCRWEPHRWGTTPEILGCTKVRAGVTVQSRLQICLAQARSGRSVVRDLSGLMLRGLDLDHLLFVWHGRQPTPQRGRLSGQARGQALDRRCARQPAIVRVGTEEWLCQGSNQRMSRNRRATCRQIR